MREKLALKITLFQWIQGEGQAEGHHFPPALFAFLQVVFLLLLLSLSIPPSWEQPVLGVWETLNLVLELPSLYLGGHRPPWVWRPLALGSHCKFLPGACRLEM